MLRTYLYIPEQLDHQVKALAKRKKVSKAEVVRDALEKGLNVIQMQNTGSAEVLLKIAELGKKHRVKGPKDAAMNMNHYLWNNNWET